MGVSNFKCEVWCPPNNNTFNFDILKPIGSKHTNVYWCLRYFPKLHPIRASKFPKKFLQEISTFQNIQLLLKLLIYCHTSASLIFDATGDKKKTINTLEESLYMTTKFCPTLLRFFGYKIKHKDSWLRCRLFFVKFSLCKRLDFLAQSVIQVWNK